jgi:hypothetical protein
MLRSFVTFAEVNKARVVCSIGRGYSATLFGYSKTVGHLQVFTWTTGKLIIILLVFFQKIPRKIQSIEKRTFYIRLCNTMKENKKLLLYRF